MKNNENINFNCFYDLITLSAIAYVKIFFASSLFAAMSEVAPIYRKKVLKTW